MTNIEEVISSNFAVAVMGVNEAFNCFTFATLSPHNNTKYIIVTDMCKNNTFEEDEYDLYLGIINDVLTLRKDDKKEIVIMTNLLGGWGELFSNLGNTTIDYNISLLFKEELKSLKNLSSLIKNAKHKSFSEIIGFTKH